MDARTILLKRIVENADAPLSGGQLVSEGLIREAAELIREELNYTDRLEALRTSLQEGDMSWEELAELQSLVPYIDESDLELMEAAGVPEQVLLNNVVVTDEVIETFVLGSTCNEAKVLNDLGPYMTLMERLYVGEEFSESSYDGEFMEVANDTARGVLLFTLGNVRTKEIYAAYQKANVQSTEQAL